MKKILILMAGLVMAACEKPLIPETGKKGGNVMLTFSANGRDAGTRAASDSLRQYFQKLCVMLFDKDGNRAFATVKTQTSTDDDFGSLTLSLDEGTYTLVAVGHSSPVTPTIKTPQQVNFTAKDGRKLFDTFCYSGEVEIGDSVFQRNITLSRATAMVRLALTDSVMPETFASMKFSYTGGSANVNPTTLQGVTKSSQAETRAVGEAMQVFTFPYLSDKGVLKMTIEAMTAADVVIRKRTFDSIPITRNRITTYTGKFFEDGDGQITQTPFGFTVNGEWDGEDKFEF